MPQKYFITRATGTQGTAVTRHLVAAGHTVHALVKDPSEPRAQHLKTLGAKLYHGTLDDPQIITEATKGCHGVFLNLMPSFTSATGEKEQARTVFSAAKAAGVKHIIYSTILTVGRQEESKYWDPTNLAAGVIQSKQDIEEEVRNGGWEVWTILRPGYFMTNLVAPLAKFVFPELGRDGVLRSSLLKETVLPLVDVDDVGVFAKEAFERPERFGGKNVLIWGEKFTVEELLSVYGAFVRKELRAEFRSEEESRELARMNPLVAGQITSRDMGDFADEEEMKSWDIPRGTFKAFLEREKEKVERTFSEEERHATGFGF